MAQRVVRNCNTCRSKRLGTVGGKTSDCCCYRFNGKESDGYVPGGVGIGGGDYIEFKYCLECGQIQGDFPVSDPDLDDS